MRARSILALALAFLASSPAGHAARGEVYALVGGRVMTVSGPVLESGTVVIRDGLIESVGAGTQAPADARLIDVKGLTITPGHFDGFDKSSPTRTQCIALCLSALALGGLVLVAFFLFLPP